MLSDGERKIYELLYKNKEGLHLREICRLANLTLPNVAKHIKKGEKNKIIISKKRGNLKICNLNFKNQKLYPLLQEVELYRLYKLPSDIKHAIDSFLEDLKEKPLIALIFGSYASKKYTSRSDLDILLIFQRVDNKMIKDVENSANTIKGRTLANIQPISLHYKEFEEKILNRENEFMKDIRENVIVLSGFDLYFKLLGRFFNV